jgi:hypothetical protein
MPDDLRKPNEYKVPSRLCSLPTRQGSDGCLTEGTLGPASCHASQRRLIAASPYGVASSLSDVASPDFWWSLTPGPVGANKAVGCSLPRGGDLPHLVIAILLSLLLEVGPHRIVTYLSLAPGKPGLWG